MKRQGLPAPGVGLFQNEDKSPMVFCLRPCLIKKKVKGHIVKGGGLCFQSMLKIPLEYRDRAIILVPDDETSPEKNAVRASYVIDCAREGMLLSRAMYLCLPQIVSKSKSESRSVGRLAYSEDEDVHIFLYIRDVGAEERLHKLTGNSFWKELERLNLPHLRGRSWQSLKDRYLKHLRGREQEYSLEKRGVGPSLKSTASSLKKQLSMLECPPRCIPVGQLKKIDTELPGSFLAAVESRRNALSPGLSQREYHILINDFVTSMGRLTKICPKSIHKVLFKTNGNEEVAKYYLLHGWCPKGFYMFSDDEDNILLKCLLNPTICEEAPALQLAVQFGEQAVLDRAAALLGISRDDFDYMRTIPLKSLKIEHDL